MDKLVKLVVCVVAALLVCSNPAQAVLYGVNSGSVYQFSISSTGTVVVDKSLGTYSDILDVAADMSGGVYIAHGTSNPAQVSKLASNSLNTLYTEDIDYSGLSDDTLHKMAWTSYNSGQILSKRSGSPSVVGFFDDSDLSWNKQYSIAYAWDFVAADSSYIYLGQGSGKKVYSYDLATGDFVDSLATSYTINGIAADNQGYIYLSDAGKFLRKYDAATLTLQSSVQYSSTAISSIDMAYDPDDGYLYLVTNGATWRRIDTSTMTQVSTGSLTTGGISSLTNLAGGVVPEPATVAMLGLGSLVVLVRKRRS